MIGGKREEEARYISIPVPTYQKSYLELRCLWTRPGIEPGSELPESPCFIENLALSLTAVPPFTEVCWLGVYFSSSIWI